LTRQTIHAKGSEVISRIPKTQPFFLDEDIPLILDDIRAVLKSGRLILGPYTQQFEKDFQEYCGVKYAVAVSSCTSALEIVLRYFDVAGKEVILPTNTFIATANAVTYSAGKPVLTDIDPDTLCMCPDDMLRKMTPNTCGVIVVHIAGLIDPAIQRIRQVCRERGIFMIEDASHAHGATLSGEKAGNLGNAGCFSMYPTKVMTTSTGGMITTNDEGLAEYAVSLRHHGVG